MKVELSEKECILIQNSLVLVAKSNGIGVESMKELLLLSDRFIVEQKQDKNE